MALNFADLFEHAADAFGERAAVACGDRQVTYRELEERTNRLAHHLAGLGVGPGDHVGLYARNSIEAIETLIASCKLRAAAVNVNYRYVENELRYMFADSDLTALVHDRRLAPVVAAAAAAAPGLRGLVEIADGSPRIRRKRPCQPRGTTKPWRPPRRNATSRRAAATTRDLNQLIPEGHKDFVEQTLLKLGVPPLPDGAQAADGVLGWLHSIARKHVEVALAHPARLIANALGPPPPDVISAAHERGMLVAALAGKAEHALRQVASGVDIVVAQGYEAGGHTGEIASMVLIPEIVDAVGGLSGGSVPVLAAGGIGCGRQIVAALALGAAGVWMGSAWLLTQEYAQLTGAPAVTEALLAATSSDTVRSQDLQREARPPPQEPVDAGLGRAGRA